MRGALRQEAGEQRQPGIIPARAGSTRDQGLHRPGPEDHPRSCGEHSYPMLPAFTAAGSSPLVRGARRDIAPALAQRGIIPARAGSTYLDFLSAQLYRDHPRSCGEHPRVWFRPSTAQGSSPLVRGAPCLERPSACRSRIIPARAGSTALSSGARDVKEDHPRSCGEHLHASSRPSTRRGSSPLVRGAQLRCDRYKARHGIIPARAGSTRPRIWAAHARRDHPRSCGEHHLMALKRKAEVGSSPLVRGALALDVLGNLLVGIIPARAGSTCRHAVLEHVHLDHPRSCGEHPPMQRTPSPMAGSSPLVRGAQLPRLRRVRREGIIPARAGSTEQRGRHDGRKADHPRSCGEHTRQSRMVRGLLGGSSPLVRGAQSPRQEGANHDRIIPARAGSTAMDEDAYRDEEDHPRSCGEHAACLSVEI